jgi:hypothetical protein
MEPITVTSILTSQRRQDKTVAAKDVEAKNSAAPNTAKRMLKPFTIQLPADPPNK